MSKHERIANEASDLPEEDTQIDSLGSRLRQERENLGMSVRETARLAGISAIYLSQLEKDVKKNPSAGVIKELSKVYDINPGELINLVDRKKDLELRNELISKFRELQNIDASKDLSRSTQDVAVIRFNLHDWTRLTRKEKEDLLRIIDRLVKLQG